MEIKFTNENFQKKVVESNIPVLVDFFAEWCGPCKMMGPIVKKLAEAYEEKIKIGKCNIDENLSIAQKYKVMSVPTFMIFVNGEVINTMVGSMSEKELETQLLKVLAQ